MLSSALIAMKSKCWKKSALRRLWLPSCPAPRQSEELAALPDERYSPRAVLLHDILWPIAPINFILGASFYLGKGSGMVSLELGDHPFQQR
jgi:hypothetical protein